MTVKIGVCGAAGKMGKAILEVAKRLVVLKFALQ